MFWCSKKSFTEEEINGTALHKAVLDDSIKDVKQLVLAGANLNRLDENGETPFHIAVTRMGRHDIMKFLLQANSNIVDIKDAYGHTPLQCLTTSHCAIDSVKILLDAGANVNVIVKKKPYSHLKNGFMRKLDKEEFFKIGFTPIFAAIKNGHFDLVKLLINYGADIEAQLPSGRTPLHVACNCLNKKIVDLLISSGADLHHKARGCSLLYAVCRADSSIYNCLNQAPICHLLIKKGANVNEKSNGYTPLHLACQKGESILISDILKAGGDTNALSLNGKTPLHLACEYFLEEMAWVLLHTKAHNKPKITEDFDFLDHFKLRMRTPLELISNLITNGADINKKNPLGYSLIHYFYFKNLVLKLRKISIKHRINIPPNCLLRDFYGSEIADLCDKYLSEPINCLLKAGANPNEKTPTGKTPIQLAFTNNQIKAQEALKQAGVSFEKDEKEF